jgi:hypothetical protein
MQRYVDAPGGRTTVSSTKKGLNFIRAGIAMALADGVPGEAEKIAARRWGAKSIPAMITKADVPATNLLQGTGAEFIGADGVAAAAEFVDAVRAASVVGRLPGLRRVPFHVPFLVMDEIICDWRAEGGAYINSPIKVSRQDAMGVLDLGSLVVVTSEFLQVSGLASELWVRDMLVRAIANKIDRDFLDPANTGSASKPASVTAAADADSPAETMWESDTYTGDPTRTVLVMNPWTAAKATSAARPNIGLRGGELNGAPVIVSTACPPELVIMLDPDAVAVAMDGADVRSSTECFLEMETAPSMTSATSVSAQTGVSCFQVGATAIIGSVRANWKLLRPESVTYFLAPAIGL